MPCCFILSNYVLLCNFHHPEVILCIFNILTADSVPHTEQNVLSACTISCSLDLLAEYEIVYDDTTVKGLVHFQNKNVLIIYSTPFHPRCSGLSFFSHEEITFFWGKYSRIFLHIVDFNGLKVQIAVLMQFQRALHNPSWGIRVLSSKTLGHLLIIIYTF